MKTWIAMSLIAAATVAVLCSQNAPGHICSADSAVATVAVGTPPDASRDGVELIITSTTPGYSGPIVASPGSVIEITEHTAGYPGPIFGLPGRVIEITEQTPGYVGPIVMTPAV